MPYTEYYDVYVNKISKSLYDSYVANGTITPTMIEQEVWIFTDDQYVSAEDIAKLAGIAAGAQVNVIEGVQVNGVDLAVNAKKVNIVVPTKTSDLTNDSGFITNTVDNLANYYKKSESYTKDEVNSLINGISTMSMQVVSMLPTSNISTTTIYLLLKSVGLTSNIYDEWIYVNNTWELIGDTQLSLDAYALKSEIPTKLSDLQNDLNLSAYALKTELHAHSNKAILDGTTASYTSEEKAKLSGVAAGAQANVIEEVKVNGVASPISNKSVNISVPAAKVRVWN